MVWTRLKDGRNEVTEESVRSKNDSKKRKGSTLPRQKYKLQVHNEIPYIELLHMLIYHISHSYGHCSTKNKLHRSQ